MPGPSTGADAWIAKAENDLLCIENNLASKSIPWDVVVFHSQQVAEKYLKAVLAAAGRPIPKIHDLVTLLKECAKVSPGLISQKEDCRGLTRYGSVSRYPENEFDMGRDEALSMVEAARRVREAVRAVLPSLSS
jgi:HEPN domain-containing protein